MGNYVHLFSPITIGSMTAKNRILMSAMSINFGVDDQGYVTDQLTAYFEARARGGAGMMLVGGGAVHPTGLELPNLPALWDDGCVVSLKKMVAAIAPYDSCFGVQLMHGGRQSYHDKKVAPSPVPAPAVVKGIPRELTVQEIGELTDSFGDAARRCREAGFDFIEIHGAHGYLINQFLASNSNLRTDLYGGSFENRCRFLFELLDKIASKAGHDFPVGVRINGEDYIQGGWTLDDATRLAPLLEDKGVAYLHISAGVYGSTQLTIPSMYVDAGCFLHLAKAVKEVVSIPVIGVGRIKTAQLADEAIGRGEADVIAMGRSLLADPELPEKSRTGRLDEIRPCIGCCLGCIHQVLALEPGTCVVNPEVGREWQLPPVERHPSPKKVLVAGGGPAGLAAAHMAALHGHDVTLCEAKEHYGGLLRLGGMAPGRSELQELLDYFQGINAKMGVAAQTNTPLTAKLVARLDPDAIILATGSLPQIPLIKGLATTRMEVLTVVEVLEESLDVGERVVILGGDQSALILADALAQDGRQIVVLNRGNHFGEQMSSNDRFYLRERLNDQQVELYKQVRIGKLDSHGIRFSSQGIERSFAKVDSFILSERFEPIREILNEINRLGIEIHIIGDAKQPRHLMFAISEAEEIGRDL